MEISFDRSAFGVIIVKLRLWIRLFICGYAIEIAVIPQMQWSPLCVVIQNILCGYDAILSKVSYKYPPEIFEMICKYRSL